MMSDHVEVVEKPLVPLYEITPQGTLKLNLHPGQKRAWDSTARFIAVLAGTQGGKALSLDTLIPTPTGCKPLAEIGVGSQVLDERGNACRVTRESPVYEDHTCYRVIFDNGAEVVADAEHRWATYSRGLVSPSVVSTDHIRLTLNHEHGIWSPAAAKPWTRIVAVEPTATVPVKCIEVDSPYHLYQCTEAAIPTHNTSFGPWWLWREIKARGGGDYLAVSSSFDMFQLKMLPAMREVFEHTFRMGRYWPSSKVIELCDPVTGQFHANRADDNMWGRIVLRSAEAKRGLESSTAKAAWLDEAGQDEFDLLAYEAVLRRLSLARGRILITTTIYNLGWLKAQFYDRWAKGQRDYDVVNFDSTENPAFPKQEMEDARERLPKWRFDMMYRGIYTRPAGMIYHMFNEHQVIPRFALDPTWKRYLGLDFGGVNTAGVYFAEEPGTRNLYAYRTYLTGGKTSVMHCRDMMAGEPMVPRCVGGAKSEGQWRAEFRNGGIIDGKRVAGLPVSGPVISDVEVGINRVAACFARDEIFIFDDLVDLLDDIRSYSRKVDSAGEITEEIDDKSTFHYADATRYIIGWLRHPGRTPEDRETAEVVKAQEEAKKELVKQQQAEWLSPSNERLWRPGF